MPEVILSTKCIETIGMAFSLLFLIGLGVTLIKEFRADRRMEAERKECFLMISRCSQLLYFLTGSVYMTGTDFDFLRYRIYRNYVRIHCMPFDVVSSERERLILADGLHWTSALRERGWDVEYSRKMNRKTSPCPYQKVLNMAVDGFGRGFKYEENAYEELEWIYYMWLASAFMYAIHSQKATDWEEVRSLCLRIEKWGAAWKMDSRYLKKKIKECRDKMDEMQ